MYKGIRFSGFKMKVLTLFYCDKEGKRFESA